LAKLTKCPNGHFYDAERSPQCPYCPAPSAPVPPPPPDGSERTVLLPDEAANQTAPIQEETVGKTVPLQEDGIGKTVPLENAGTPVQRPASDGDRKFLIASAVMAGLSALYSLFMIFKYIF